MRASDRALDYRQRRLGPAAGGYRRGGGAL